MGNITSAELGLTLRSLNAELKRNGNTISYRLEHQTDGKRRVYTLRDNFDGRWVGTSTEINLAMRVLQSYLLRNQVNTNQTLIAMLKQQEPSQP